MRVVAGSARGHKLQPVPGNTTRPITDRAKEALFSILGDWIAEKSVLDLFGGTGAVGIEALSRGAAYVHFIDHNRAAIRTIQKNLVHCKVDARATTAQRDSFAFVNQFGGEPFDLIYIAPPQYQELWSAALTAVDARPQLLTDDGVVIVQLHHREETTIALKNLVKFDRRRYGSVLLIFYERAE